MKKLFSICFVLMFIVNSFCGCTTSKISKEYNYDDVKNTVIRFHVIANSDNNEDQSLKLNIKNKVIEYLYPLLSDSKSIDESRDILINNEDKVKEIAYEVINDEGFNYQVDVELSRENFPQKEYGSIVLPQGEYEAYRIIVGEGKGHNWWCVMFPPLCFIDVTKGQVEDEKSKNELDEEIEKSKNEKDIEYSFKSIELLKRVFG